MFIRNPGCEKIVKIFTEILMILSELQQYAVNITEIISFLTKRSYDINHCECEG